MIETQRERWARLERVAEAAKEMVRWNNTAVCSTLPRKMQQAMDALEEAVNELNGSNS